MQNQSTLYGLAPATISSYLATSLGIEASGTLIRGFTAAGTTNFVQNFDHNLAKLGTRCVANPRAKLHKVCYVVANHYRAESLAM